MTAIDRRVLWAANMRTKKLEERLAAARKYGFDAMSVFPIDYHTCGQAGWSDDALARAFADAEIAVVAIDPFTQWVPDWRMPDGYPEESRSFVEFDEASVLHMADVFSAEAINCVEPFGVVYPTDVLIEALAAFADRAAARRRRVTLEFMPTSGIRSLADGWSIVEGAGRENLGLVFDAWHFLRSDANEALLRQVPGRKVFEVQLADGLLSPVGDLMNDLLHHRLAPGTGELALAPTVAALKEIGAFRSVGPEVFSDAFNLMSADEATRIARDAMLAFLDAAIARSPVHMSRLWSAIPKTPSGKPYIWHRFAARPR